MWPNKQETADLIIFTEEILNGKLHFCAITFHHINQVCCYPRNKSNVRTDWSIKYFWWYIAFQRRHVIDITGKSISFVKELSGKMVIMIFYLKIQKRAFIRILSFLSEFQLIRINIFVIVLKLVIVSNSLFVI